MTAAGTDDDTALFGGVRILVMHDMSQRVTSLTTSGAGNLANKNKVGHFLSLCALIIYSLAE